MELISQVLFELPPEEQKLVCKGITTLVKSRMLELQKNLNVAEEKNKQFLKKYGTNFDNFTKNFPEHADMEKHEDLIEWEFWYESEKQYRRIIDKYRHMAGR